jgi:hypothetical protein
MRGGEPSDPLHQLRDHYGPRLSQGLTLEETDHAHSILEAFDHVIEYLGWRVSRPTACDNDDNWRAPGVFDHPIIFRRGPGERLQLMQPYVDGFLDGGAEEALRWSSGRADRKMVWSFDASFHKNAGRTGPMLHSRTLSVVLGTWRNLSEWSTAFGRCIDGYFGGQSDPYLRFHMLDEWKLAREFAGLHGEVLFAHWMRHLRPASETES